MLSDTSGVFLIIVTFIMTGGALLTLVGHLLFLHQLRSGHPDLWRTYCQIAFTTFHVTSKHAQLCHQVYSHITQQAVVRARRTDLLFRRIFGLSSLASAFALAAWRIIPALRP